MFLFNYDARNKSKKSEARAKMLRMRELLKVRSHFSPAENPFQRQNVQGENVLKVPPRERSLRNKRDKNFVQKVKNVILVSQEILSPAKKTAKKEMSTMCTEIISRDAEKSSKCFHLQ